MKTFAVTPISFEPRPMVKGNKFLATLQNWWRAISANWPLTILILLFVIFLVSATVRTIDKNGDMSWLLGPNGVPEQKGSILPEDVAKALGPIMALTLAIERLIETIFDMFETDVIRVANKVTSGGNALKTINQIQDLYAKQLEQAAASFEEILNKNGSTPREKEEAQNVLSLAQQKVYEAGTLLENLPKDPIYMAWKRAISIGLGLSMGMVVAVYLDHGVFYYLNLSVPRIVDMLVTGFVLGAGSGPLHSLIGILQGAKDSLTNLGKLADTTAIKEEIKSLRSEMVLQDRQN